MASFDNNNPERNKLIKAAHTALTVTCQLYQWVNDESDKFTANGCAVLVEHNSNYYCFSNAHVLADNQLGKTFFLLKDGTSMTVGGELRHSEPISSESRQDDLLDIAIVKLSANVVEYLKSDGQQFLSLNQILTGFNLSKGDHTLIAGYPASKTKVDIKKKALKFNPLISRTIPYLKKIKNKKFATGFHHIVEYPINSFRETSNGQRMRAPKPHGISGSGLWLILSENEFNYFPVLIGIFSEYHENKAILLSTKIDFFIDLLRQLFDPSIKNNGFSVELSNEE